MSNLVLYKRKYSIGVGRKHDLPSAHSFGIQATHWIDQMPSNHSQKGLDGWVGKEPPESKSRSMKVFVRLFRVQPLLSQ